MFKLAFSTVACPDRTIRDAFELASACGYDGIELRTLGANDPTLLCEPALTGAGKLRQRAVATGVEIACLSTSFRFDAPVWPPVIGRALPSFAHRSRPAQRAVDAADDMGCRLVRVFGFEVQGNEKRTRAIKRIAAAMMPVLDTARARSVNVVIENGGSFQTPAQLAELFEACEQHPQLKAVYDIAVGSAGGATLEQAVRELGTRLAMVRVRTLDAEGNPRPTTPAEARSFSKVLTEAAYRGWVSVEWPVAWVPELVERHGATENVLRTVADALRMSMPASSVLVSNPRVAVGV